MHINESAKRPEAHARATPRPRTMPLPLSTRPGVGGLAPAELLALQRAVGNAAVSRAIQEARHQHGPGCSHQNKEGVQEAPLVQRSSVHDALASTGQPLAAPLREEMETRLGADFADVRLHTGTTAQRSAAEIGARAYTSGNHVVIGEGGDDKHTLAHELTHVIQQRQGPVAGKDNGQGLRVSEPGDRFEREAEANARRVMSASAGSLQRASAVDEASAAMKQTGPIQRMPSQASVLRNNAVTNYDQRQAEFQGNATVPVEARVSPERLVDLLVAHMNDRGERGRIVKELLRRMAERFWCITAGVHAGGLGGAGRGADPNRHITINAGGRGYHVQLMANDELQNITSG
ncbi:DUF4157 domain-containing protein [Streptomyces sp. NPDC017979]|uniref:DUF4157 domain-containing protein n=1 Tax=Streptomyces sp. NPDC017979 TaxID=3365024 RepID=UPI0037872F54